MAVFILWLGMFTELKIEEIINIKQIFSVFY